MISNEAQDYDVLIEKLHASDLDSDGSAELVNKFGEKLLIEDLITLVSIQEMDRETSFKLSRICKINGLFLESFQALREHIDGMLYGPEIHIYLDAILAAREVDRIMTFYWNQENPPPELAMRIVKEIQNFDTTNELAEIVQREMNLSIEQNLHPIESNRQLLKSIKGEFLYEIKEMLNLKDRYIDFKIAKALVRFGRYEEARKVLFLYTMLEDADAIAIWATTFNPGDYIDGTVELPNHWLHSLLDNGSKSFAATAWRVNAYQEYARGNIPNSIRSAEEAAFNKDIEAAQFLIHVLKHDRDKWILYLRLLSNIKHKEEMTEKYSRAPKSDLDSKKQPLASSRDNEVKVNKRATEEIWYCREALWKSRVNKSNSLEVFDWDSLSCNNHIEGINRLKERSLIPPLNSTLWDLHSQLNAKDFEPINLEELETQYSLKLWLWQKEALQAWSNHGRVGMVEAATGSGKSRLGIASALEALIQNKSVVVVVPRKILQDQWIKNFSKAGLGKYIDTLGGDNGSIYPKAGSATKGRILIALVQSLSKHQSVLPKDKNSLLIADEIHLFTGEEYRKIFAEEFHWRLGMTATLPDGTDDRNLLRNYFGGDAIYSYEIPKAIADGVILPYEIALIRVKPTPEEQFLLNGYSREIQNCFKELSYLGAISPEYRNFDREISKLEELDRLPEITKRYRDATNATDQILAHSASNGLALQLVSPIIKSRGKTLIFSDFNETMKKTIDVLLSETVLAKHINHEILGENRNNVINELVNGKIDAIVSPQAMDVGVDIPELELGVYVGIRRERLNLIQRLGRFLRKHEGKTTPLIIIPVAIGHHDDPNLAGNEDLKFSAFNYLIENALKPILKFDVHDTEKIRDFVKSKV